MVALSKEDPNKPLAYFSDTGYMDPASTIAAKNNGKKYMIGDGNGQGNLNGFSFMEGDKSGPLLFKAMIELATQTKHLTLDKFHRFEDNKLEPKVAGDLNEKQALSEIAKLDNKVEALIAGMMDRKTPMTMREVKIYMEKALEIAKQAWGSKPPKITMGEREDGKFFIRWDGYYTTGRSFEIVFDGRGFQKEGAADRPLEATAFWSAGKGQNGHDKHASSFLADTLKPAFEQLSHEQNIIVGQHEGSASALQSFKDAVVSKKESQPSIEAPAQSKLEATMDKVVERAIAEKGPKTEAEVSVSKTGAAPLSDFMSRVKKAEVSKEQSSVTR